MSPRAGGFSVVIDGSPYIFNTRGVSISSWPSGEQPVGSAQVADTLDWPSDFRWREVLHPTDGELEYTGGTLRLHDAPADTMGYSGVAAGKTYPVSYLATRTLRSLSQGTLASAITSTDTTITLVAAAASMPTANFVLWLDGEAILCDSRSGTTITVNASGRGYYGTRAVAHTVDYDANVYPIVYFECPGFARRRIRLFSVTSAGVASLEWTGYVTRAPTIKGAAVALTCQSAWEVDRNRELGRAPASTYVRGFSAAGLRVSYLNAGQLFDVVYRLPWSTSTTVVYDTLSDLLEAAMNSLRTSKAADVGVTAAYASAYVNDNFLSITLGSTGGTDYTLRFGYSAAGRQPTVSPLASDTGGGVRQAVVSVTGPPSALAILYALQPVRLPITSTWGLPTTWDPVTPVTGLDPYYATVRPVLVADVADKQQLVLSAGSSTPVTNNDATLTPSMGPSFYCTGRVRDGLSLVDFSSHGTLSYSVIDQQLQLRLAYVVEANHWAIALRAALNDATFVQPNSDPRNWTWSNFGDVLATADRRQTQWVLDGTKKLSDYLKGQVTLAGCCVGVRGGKLCLVPVRDALASDVASFAITSQDLANGTDVEWTMNVDGVVNVVRVKGRTLDVTVRDSRSVAVYGEARTIELDIEGLVDERDFMANPVALARMVLSRVLGLWSDVTTTVRFTLPRSAFASLALGQTGTLELWLPPDGAGGRGLAPAVVGSSVANAMILGREPDLKDDTMVVTALLTGTGYGYAPCCRVASASGANVTVATGYANGSDYARSDESSYAFASTYPSDGGTSFFLVGDKVRLLERNNSSPTTQDATIIAVDPASKKITLDASVSAGILAVLGAGGIVDVIYQHYSVCQTSQHRYAFIGGAAVIDSTSDPSLPWSA